MKTIKHLLLTVAVLLYSTSIFAQTFEVDGITYEVWSSTQVYVNKCDRDYSGAIEIPPKVSYNGKTYSVRGISSYAFAYCSGLTSVDIPSSVTSIGLHAFSSCSGLTSVTIPNSVTSIYGNAFNSCSNLISVYITDLSAWCRISFDDTSSNPLSYAKHLYLNDKEINDLVIPDDVTNIKEFVFNGYTGLTSVSIHNNVNSIWHNSFSNCSKLTSIKIDEKNQIFDSRDGCNAIIETSTNKLISGCISTIIPNSVTSIGDYAFYECSGLTSMTIPNGVTSIGNYAFYECSGLTSMTIPNGVTSIGESAFQNCPGLTSVTIGNGIERINYAIFPECENLTSLTIGSNVKTIDINFTNSPLLTNVYCYAKKTPIVGDSYVFHKTPLEYCTLHVPASSIREYMSTEPWSNFGTIVSLTDEEESEPDPNDMTPLIVNAGFDEDLAFSTDGKYKEGTTLNAENNSLSERSWSYVHPDGSCYAHAKTAEEGNENWKQKDSRTWASNGFVAQINGWECRKTEYPKCEWVYSGALPYGLHPTAIPIADDGDRYQDSPSKPAFAANTDNRGALFLRVGWSGSLSYKQTLNIPGGKYRFEYWTINANTSSSKSYTDLSNIGAVTK